MTWTRNWTLSFKLALAALILGTSAVSGLALNAYQGKFTLAVETHWGGVTLPAGDYTLTIQTTGSPYRLFVRGKNVGAIITAVTADSKADSGHSQLNLVENADGFAVQTFDAPDLGLTFIYPTTEHSRRDRMPTGQKIVPPTTLNTQLNGGTTSIAVQTTTR